MLTSPGIGSGLDVSSIVSQLVAAEGQPTLVRLANKEAGFQSSLSALGSLKSALSGFRDVLTPLTDIDVFRSRQVTSGDEEFFTATVNTSASPGTYDIEVERLAQAQQLTSSAFVWDDPGTTEDDPDSAFPVGHGNLVIEIGDDGESVMNVAIFEEANTLADIRDAINQADDNPGIVASIVNGDDGARLVLTSTQVGVDKTLTISSNGGDGGLKLFDYDPVGGGADLTETQAAQDALIRIDGNEVTRDSNTVAGAIDGVVIDLQKAEVGVENTLTVAFDNAAAKEKIQGFVDGYNEMVEALAALGSYDPDTQAAGALQGDSTLRQVQASIRQELQGSLDDFFAEFRTLASIGITTDLEGRLEIDDAKLDEALGANFDAVGRLFSNDEGLATRVDDILEPYLGTGGLIETRTDTLENQIEEIEDERVALEERLLKVEERYLAQFTALDTLISELNNTSAFLAQQLATLPTPSADI